MIKYNQSENDFWVINILLTVGYILADIADCLLPSLNCIGRNVMTI